MIKDVCFNDRERCSTGAACDAHYERGIWRNCINARGWTESMRSRNFGRDRRRLNDVQPASASIDGSVLYHSPAELASGREVYGDLPGVVTIQAVVLGSAPKRVL